MATEDRVATVPRYELSSSGPRQVEHGYYVAWKAYEKLEAENQRLQQKNLVMETAIRHAIHDFDLINETIIKACKVHPFTLTPLELRNAVDGDDAELTRLRAEGKQ